MGRSRPRVASLVASLVLGPLALLGGGSRTSFAFWPGDPYINVPVCTYEGPQHSPRLAPDGQGGAIVVWYDYRLGPPDGAIYAQRFTAQGEMLWVENGVPICLAPSHSYDPRVVPDGRGGAIAAWMDMRDVDDDLYAQRMDGNGVTLWQTDGVPICTFPGDQNIETLIEDGAGGAICAWQDYRVADGDSYVQRISAAGEMLWQTGGVPLCTAVNEQGGTYLATDGAGGAFAVWGDLRSGSVRRYVQRIDAAGNVLWGENGMRVCAVEAPQHSGRIVSDGMGEAIVIWVDERSGGYEVYGQRLDGAGNLLWDPQGVPLCTAIGGKGLPVSTSDGLGGAITVWMDWRADPLWDLYAQRVSVDGVPQWSMDGVPVCTVSGYQGTIDIASDSRGGAVTAWVDGRGSTYDIYAQRLDADGNTLWASGARGGVLVAETGLPVCNAVQHQLAPSILTDGGGGAFVAWNDYRNSEDDIYAQRVYANGTLDGAGMPTPTISPMTVTATPSISATVTISPTPTISYSATPSVSPTSTPSATPTLSLTPTPSPLTPTPSQSRTPGPIELTLWMPATTFAEGDPCALELEISNLGPAQDVDLYVLLDVFGAYWCYPSWQPLDVGLDHETVTVPAGDSSITLIPQFTMPAVSPIGPLYFCAAMFEPGTLSLETLVSNGDSYEFWLVE